ncbi:hypothetical protein E6H36_12030 [Candidatus Bathyarchaeota archaeon]|nr:MAG: hypothetical protein E6H36_12030 [Candidatus Bathyarchaeota archaeon]TMI32932.1 MAG: hypothetical protein E6H29_01355 [Candidatus Bathyarchaeota archaeon]
MKDAARREVIVANLIRDAVSLGKELLEERQTQNDLLATKTEVDSIRRRLPNWLLRKKVREKGSG